jgi:O-antigen/teichoic acid export membrane protein
MTGNGGVSASTYLAIIVVNVALAIPLIALFGLNGAAIASAVAMALRALWLARAVQVRLGVDTSILSAIRLRGIFGGRHSPAGTPAE